MSDAVALPERERDAGSPVRALANQAFSRAAGAPLVEGNSVRLLKDARENYPAWLDAIRMAKHYIHFESYIIHEDDSGMDVRRSACSQSAGRSTRAALTRQMPE